MTLPRKRIRNKSVLPKTSTWTYSLDAVPVAGSVSWSTFTSIQNFTDYIGGDFGHWKGAENLSIVYRGSNLLPWYGDNDKLVTPHFTPPFLGTAQSFDLAYPGPSSAVVSEQILKAFNSFSDQFPAQLDGAEFLWGLGSLKGTFSSLADSLARITKGDLGGASALFLQNSFELAPLKGDIAALMNLTKSVNDRLAFLRRTYGVPTILRYGSRVSVPAYLPRTLTPVRGWGVTLRPISSTHAFRAQAELVHKLEHLDDAAGLLRGFIGAMGLDNPLKAVWVNLPLSFIADWFFRVSDRLDRLTSIQAAEPWMLTRVMHSIQSEAQFEVRQTPSNLISSTKGIQSYHLGFVDLKRYTRVPTLPVSTDLFFNTDLSPGQLTLLFAMLHANS
jgi:hypothetical protein